MTFEVQAVVFPRSRFTVAQAQAWSSLHGFDHEEVEIGPEWIQVHHRPREAFHTATLHPMPFGHGVEGPRRASQEGDRVYGLVGHRIRRVEPSSAQLTYLDSEEARANYEEASALLRYMAILGGSRVGPGEARRGGNQDVVAWYRRWFLATHRGPTDDELAVAEAIAEGLGQAGREHACAYARKLGGVCGELSGVA